jgi:hypothetical protein
MHPWFQAQVIAYDQIRQIEKAEHEAMILKATHGTKSRNPVRKR